MFKPLDQIIVTQAFGARPEYYGPGGHNGVDLRTRFNNPKNSWWNNLNAWQPIYAVEDGKCVARYKKDGYGTHIYLTGSSGTFLYAHLKNVKSNLTAKVIGEELHFTVKAGDVIGLTGNTGNSTASHLHFSYKPSAVFVDPMPLLHDNATFEFTYLSDTDDIYDAVVYCDQKFKEFSNGHLSLDYDFQYIPPVSAEPNHDLDQFKAFGIIDSQPSNLHGVVLGYYGSNTSMGYKTYVTPKNRVATDGYKPFPKEALLFELGHQIILYYNTHRGVNPFIENIDNYSGGEQIVKDKIKSILPYLSVFNII